MYRYKNISGIRTREKENAHACTHEVQTSRDNARESLGPEIP